MQFEEIYPEKVVFKKIGFIRKDRLIKDDIEHMQHIIKVKHMTKKDKDNSFHNYTMALRENGQLDFYYDFQLVKHHNDPNKIIEDIDVDASFIYFTAQEKIRPVTVDKNKKMSFRKVKPYSD